MKKCKVVLAGLCLLLGVLVSGTEVSAAAKDTIKNGIYIEDIDISGMTPEEASAKVEQYVAELGNVTLTLRVDEENHFAATVSELGLSWGNKDIVKEACGYGTKGNIIQRYKALKDLEHENKVYSISFLVDEAAAESFLTEKCAAFHIEAKDAGLKRENGQFVIEDGVPGRRVEIPESVQQIAQFVNDGWNHESGTVELVTVTDEPRGSKEELSRVKDVLGTFTTDFHTSGKARTANVANGCGLINGVTLYPGEQFSTYETVSPFSEENGYFLAGSYLNGMVVESLGGGICQVSTTLYNAVLRAELQVDERFNHSMIVSYVDPSADAAISGTAKDFKFTNSLENPVYIEGSVSPDKKITFTIYGVETRDSGRKVTYESEVLKKTVPDTEKIIADAGAPVGSISVQSAHIGYQARLWKVVEENGQEVSRDQINSSSYQMSPKTATVGIASENPAVTAAMQAAIATGSIDHVKSVIANYKASTDPAAIQAAQQAAAEAAAIAAQNAGVDAVE